VGHDEETSPGFSNVWDMMRRRVRALQTPPAMLGELGELFGTKQMSCPLLTAWEDGVKPSIMLEVEIYPTEPFSLIYFVEAIVTIFLFFIIGNLIHTLKIP
jgi:hypothetical protein